MSYKDDTGIREPKLVERIACPMCGWIRQKSYGISKRTGEPREVRFDKMNLDTAPILRLERMSGRGKKSKDAQIELVDSHTLAQLPDDIKQQIVSQCKKILSILD